MTTLILKTLHLLSFTVWMAGLFALPFLYRYHTKAIANGEADKMLQTMERRLLRLVVTPAMILTFVFGISLVVDNMAWMRMGWLHAKIMLVLGLAGFHGFMAKTRKDFAAGDNTKSEQFYRLIKLIPLALLAGTVFLAVVKPF